MRIGRKAKTIILSALALFAVGTAAVATAAWFVLEAQPITTDLVTGSANVNVDQANVTGHKIIPQINPATGFVDTESTTITSKTGLTIDTHNDNQATADINFNVPTQGVGYYLIKKNPDNTYRFNYFGTSYAWKLNNVAGTDRYIAKNLTIATTDRYQVWKYDFVNHSTDISLVSIGSCTTGANVTENVIAPSISGNGVSAWLTVGETNDLSFESAFELSEQNIASAKGGVLDNGPDPLKAGQPTAQANKGAPMPKAAAGDATGRTYTFYCNWGADTASWTDKYVGYSTSTSGDSWTWQAMTQASGNLWYATIENTNVKRLIFRHTQTYYKGCSTDPLWTSDSNGIQNRFNITSRNENADPGFYGNWAWETSYGYTVNYNANGGSGTMTSHTRWIYSDSGGSTIKTNTFTREGYIFDGWNTKSDGSGRAVEDGATLNYGDALSMKKDDTVTLYAQWTPIAGPSETKVTVKIYDPFGYLGESPRIWAWTTNPAVYPQNNGTDGKPSETMTDETDSTSGLHYWEGEFSEDYDKFIISNTNSWSGKQTADLLYSDTNSGAKFYVITADDPTSGDNSSTTYTGAWYSSLRSSGTRKVKVFDGVNVLGSTPYIYAWTTTTDVYPANSEAGGQSAIQMSSEVDSTSGQTIWYANVSSTYDRYIVKNQASFTGSKQSAEFTWSDSSSGAKYYVITSDDPTAGDSDTTTYGGHWYTALTSKTKNTYYFYDNRSTNRWTAPKAYVWTESAQTSNADNYTLFPWRNDNRDIGWAGISMRNLTAEEAAAKHVEKDYAWVVEVSSSYTNIIFNNGDGAGGDTPGTQTINLSTSGNNGKWFVLTGSVIPSGSDKNKWAGEWTDAIYGITFKASYFINGSKSSIASDTLDTTSSLHVYNYQPTYVAPSSLDKGVASNGIVYYFTRDTSTATWFTDEACQTPYTPTELNSSLTLYTKYNTSNLSDYKTFYVDSSVWGTGFDVRDGGNTKTYFTTGGSIAVGPNLYRITVPSNYVIQLAHNTWAINQGVDVDESGSTNFLYIENQNIAASKSWHSLSSIDIGTATIQKYDTSSSSWVDLTDMAIGDIEHWNTSPGGSGSASEAFSNWFVYERGIQLPVNTKFRVVYSRTMDGDDVIDDGASYGLGTTGKTFSTQSDYDGSLPVYLSGDGGLKTTGYTGNARFNFYICYSSGNVKLTVAIVPDYGNGFYIMSYNASTGTNHFMNAVKMNSSSNIAATYTGYYVGAANSKIFIRSYNDAKDHLYTTLDATTVSSGIASHKDADEAGVITIAQAGYYNIYITGEIISITNYSGIDDFFKLNPLDTTDVGSSSAIKNQRTTFILEVPFSTTNTFDSDVSLHVSNPISAFVGVTLFVTSTRLNPDTNLYSTLTNDSVYTTLSDVSDGNVDNVSSTHVHGTATHYAYIVIDYLPTVANSYHAAANYSTFNTATAFLLTFRIDLIQRA